MTGGLDQQLRAYIQQYSQDGVLLDTNVLLLLLAHRFDPQLVGASGSKNTTLKPPTC